MRADEGPLAAFAKVLAANTSGGADLLVVVAHPDDETIGIGGHLHRLPEISIVHVTDGAPRDGRDAARAGFARPADYAAARRRELEAAMAEAGIGAASLTAFGIPDQQAATNIPAVARRIRSLIEAQRPRFVLTHPYEGGHPDHDATALSVWAACRDLKGIAPAVIEMAFYHLGPADPIFLRFSGDEPELLVNLDPADREMKQRMLSRYETQREILGRFAFDVERFRLAPAYDFTTLPNGGRLLYESWGLGLDGSGWLRHVSSALAEMRPDQA